MTIERHLDWQNCFNVRDLGGLRAAGGRATRWRAVVRGDAADRLTQAGWSALWAHGIRTVVDLRNDEELGPDAVARPEGITTVRVPLDGTDDTEFWNYCWSNDLVGNPLYYQPFLERKPERCAAAVAAVARARPGGVLLHCVAGRDRTGLVTLLLLALAGVRYDDIAADYQLSAERLRPFYARMGWPDQDVRAQETLARRGTTARDRLLTTLASLDADAYLRSAGLGDGDLAAVRARLLGP